MPPPESQIRYELWEDESGFTFFPESNASARALLTPQAKLVWECRAASWDEAQAQKHQHLNWEPYVPAEE